MRKFVDDIKERIKSVGSNIDSVKESIFPSEGFETLNDDFEPDESFLSTYIRIPEGNENSREDD